MTLGIGLEKDGDGFSTGLAKFSVTREGFFCGSLYKYFGRVEAALGLSGTFFLEKELLVFLELTVFVISVFLPLLAPNVFLVLELELLNVLLL